MFEKQYKCMSISEFSHNEYVIKPITYDNHKDIMHWRNEQIDILRQKEVLTIEKQEIYFKTVVSELFNQDNPKQILMGYYKNNEFIGYGGIVHIDWVNKNAEISFVLKTSLNEPKVYIKLFEIFLNLMKLMGKSLNLHKIYTVGYDIADYRFQPLINVDFEQEALLKNHILVNNELLDVKIYSYIL